MAYTINQIANILLHYQGQYSHAGENRHPEHNELIADSRWLMARSLRKSAACVPQRGQARPDDGRWEGTGETFSAGNRCRKDSGYDY